MDCFDAYITTLCQGFLYGPSKNSTWHWFSVVGQCATVQCMVVMERPRCDEWGEMTWWHGDTPINIQIQDAQIISKNVQIGWETDTGHQNSASILHNLGVIKFLRFYKPEQLLHWRWVGRSAGAISAVANTEVTTYFGWHTSFSLNR